MPEGPSILILKEEVAAFVNKEVVEAGGYAPVDMGRLKGKKILSFKSWGKHFLICFRDFTIRVHLLLFGTYRINAEKDSNPALHLRFSNGELNFYTCSVKMIDQPADKVYDWSADVMSDQWDPARALAKLKLAPDRLVADILLDQDIFSGVGNIIRNEVLFRIRVHPASRVGKLPLKKKKEMIREAVQYSFDFLQWKREYVLKQHWLVHTRTICPRCHIPVVKEYLGVTKRRAFFCNNCQVLYE